MEVQKKTISSIFIVPTLKIDKNQLKNNNFINAFIKDINKEEQYQESAYLLFKPKDLDSFMDFVDGEYERTPHIIDDYDYDEFVVLVYTLNPKYMEDFNLIKKGKYSKTSKSFQELFPKVVKVIKNGLYRDEMSLQHKIFNKTEDLKQYWEEKIVANFTDDMEVWEGFDIENETLNLNKIKKLV